ncbi:MAG: tetratricopeptide repeat protein, partial [Proteobacteria bacterium]|nr:tetratricopeptide repeat protein [Pseudomonadota bacterium]
MSRGDFAEALELLGRAVRIDPFGATVLQNFGNAQRRVGQLSQARETFARAIDLHPTNPNSSWMLGKLQVDDLGEISEGLRSFLTSAEIDRDDYEIAAYVAMTYLSLEMPAAALPWMQRALEDGPGTVSSIALEVVYLLLTGEEDRAMELAIDALLDRPSRFGSHSMLSDSLIIIAVDQLIGRGRADEAVRLLLDAAPKDEKYFAKPVYAKRHNAMLALNEMPRRWLVALACAYRATGEIRKAADTLETIAV